MKRDSRRFNRRISIEEPTRTANGAGGYTKGWAAITDGEVWAEMIPLRGGEALERQVLAATQLWKVTIRWRDDVTVEQRVVFEGRPMNIRAAQDPDGRRFELVMTCEEGVKV